MIPQLSHLKNHFQYFNSLYYNIVKKIFLLRRFNCDTQHIKANFNLYTIKFFTKLIRKIKTQRYNGAPRRMVRQL